MIRKPDEIRECTVDGQDVVLYRFDAAPSARAVRGKLTGSVGKVIECDVRQSDLHAISPKHISPLSFGLGAAAKAGDDAIDNLGEALKMNGRFFMALPSRVDPSDPYISTDKEVMSPFFFQADMNFGARPPMLEDSSSGPALMGELASGAVFAFEAEEPVNIASILAEIVPEGLNAIYFRGTAFARDVVDKIMKVSPTPAHRKPYGKITSPQGLKDFFVMKTIPQGFSGMVELATFGAAFKSYTANTEKQLPNLDELLGKLFYVMPGTVQSADMRIHVHGLVMSASDNAPVPAGEAIDLKGLPLSNVKEGSEISRSGRIVHLENTTKLASGAFAVVPVTDLDLN